MSKMDFEKARSIICREIELSLSKVDREEVESLVGLILNNEKVFVIGVGKVMLMMQALAKRLKHLGLDSYVVGETTTPGIQKGDLLLAGSGSGETITTVNVARLAKKHGAKISLITSSPDSTLRKLSDVSVRIPCSTKLHLPGETFSKQSMTTLFEQCLLIFGDCVSMIIQKKLNISEEKMWKTHANLE